MRSQLPRDAVLSGTEGKLQALVPSQQKRGKKAQARPMSRGSGIFPKLS